MLGRNYEELMLSSSRVDLHITFEAVPVILAGRGDATMAKFNPPSSPVGGSGGCSTNFTIGMGR